MTTTTQPTCAWCGQPDTNNDCIHTACELLCHEAACLWEHVRECETCLAAQQTQAGFTDLFWECRCEEHYLHPQYNPECPACGTLQDEGMPASLNMVFAFAAEWRLDESLVATLRDQYPNVWLPDDETLCSQPTNFARLDDDLWLEVHYEDHFGSGLDF